MNRQFDKLFSEAEGRYLEPTEQAALIDYANSLEARLAAMRAIQEHEGEIVEASVDAMLGEQPEVFERHVQVREKSIRDMTLVLRCCAMAMVRDSEDYLEMRMLPWFRTILNAFDMQQAAARAYRELIAQVEVHLEPEHFELVAPLLKLTHDKLSQ